MDRNQFPRRMCGFALCLLAIEVGIWQSRRGSLTLPRDTSTGVPLGQSQAVEMSAVESVSQVHPVIPDDSANPPESFGDR